MDLREPPTDLPALEYNLTAEDRDTALHGWICLQAQRIQRNERDAKRLQG